MGTLVGATVNRQPGPTGPDQPIRNPRRRPKVKKGERLVLVYKRQSAKPEKQKNRTSSHGTDGHGYIGKQSARAPKMQHDKND